MCQARPLRQYLLLKPRRELRGNFPYDPLTSLSVVANVERQRRSGEREEVIDKVQEKQSLGPGQMRWAKALIESH